MVKQARRYCAVSLGGTGELGGDHRVTVFAFYASGWRFVWVIPCYRSVHPPLSTALSSRDLPPKWESPPHAYCMWGRGTLIYATPPLHRQSRALAAALSSTLKVRKSTHTLFLVPSRDRRRLKRSVWGFETNRLTFRSTRDPPSTKRNARPQCVFCEGTRWFSFPAEVLPAAELTGCGAWNDSKQERGRYKGGGSSLTMFV